ncbi:MAG TPA: RNA polymerase sigma factor [Terriglobia bacterium]|nr:RNA polymerase sigma factor [Terriglobia bacterium]
MREITLSSSERLLTGDEVAEPAFAFAMDEAAFRAFYERTARPLRAYLARITNPALADDLLQESYYRLLRAGVQGPKGGPADEAYLKNYLYRIATNLVRDHWRRARPTEPLEEMASEERAGENVERQSDVADALDRLKPRERQLLWLAYVEGASHQEIARIAGLRSTSVRLLLFRARRRLAAVLRERGLAS